MDQRSVNAPTLVLFSATPDLYECCPSSRISITNPSGSDSRVVLTPRYTVLVESVKEYCRIAWDVLPLQKSIKVCVASDSSLTTAYACNSWDASDQNIGALNSGLARCFSPAPFPPTDDALANMNGEDRSAWISRTAGLLQEQFTDGGACNGLPWLDSHSTLRLMYVHTSYGYAAQVERLLTEALGKLLEKSAILAKLNTIIYTNIFVQTITNEQLSASAKEPSRIFEQSNVSVLRENVITNCQFCFPDFMSLLEQHLLLCKAVVTNIPMKDESGQGASQDYDVSLYILRNDEQSTGNSSKNNKTDDAVPPLFLKWLPPREVGQIDDDINQWVASCRRVCPVVPKSRPTQCLLQFVLKGKTVYLQQKQETVSELSAPSKLSAPVLPVTHYIRTMPAGSIYLFEIDRDFQANRKVFNDIPAASASAGGKVDNYCVGQVEDILRRFAFDMSLPAAMQILQQHATSGVPVDMQQFQQRLSNSSRYFPLTYGQSLIPCSVELLELHNIIQEPQLNDALLARIIQRIDSLMSIEQTSGSKFLSVIAPVSLSCVQNTKRNEASSSSAAAAGAGRGRAYVKELWKALWSELIVLSESLADVSEAHRHVLEYLQRKRPGMPNQMLTFFRTNNSHQHNKFFRGSATTRQPGINKSMPSSSISHATGIPERRFLMPAFTGTFSDAIQKQTRVDIEEGKRRLTLSDLPRSQMAVGTNLYPNLPNPNERPFSFAGSGGGGGSGSRGIVSGVNMAKKAKVIVP